MKSKLLSSVKLFAGASLLATAALGPISEARADYASTLLSYGPIGYWRFNETVASPPLNTLTNASSLGSILNGAVAGAVTKGQPGIIGTSFLFSNPDAQSDVGADPAKIDVAYNAAINPKPPFSVEFWANPVVLSSDSTGYCPLSNFNNLDGAGGDREGWLFYCNSAGKWQVRYGTTSGYAGIVTETTGTAQPGHWEHIVATWDGTNGLLYSDGVLVGSAAVPVGNWTDNPSSFLRFGATPLIGDDGFAPYEQYTSNNGNRGFDGYLEQAAIYTNILSPATIAAHYAAATNNPAGYSALILSANPVAYWPFSDPAVTAPSTNSFPIANNSGSLGSEADATIEWGSLAAQPGPGYPGFGADGSVFFDGLTGYIVINDTPDLHFNNSPNYITLAAWVKPLAKDFYRDIIDNGYDGNDDETFLRISPGGDVGNTNPYLQDGYGSGNYYEFGTANASSAFGEDAVLVPVPAGDIGNWVFIAGVFDGVNWNLYRNGVLVGQWAATADDVGATVVDEPWTIGSIAPDSANNAFNLPPQTVAQEEDWDGWIAEPAIFTNALTAANISSLYNAAGVPPVITQAPVNPSPVYAGGSIDLSVFAEGAGTLGYEWVSNGIPTGDTTTNYAISDISVGTYTIGVVVTNAYGTNTPTVTFTVLSKPPFITTPPVAEKFFAGQPFSFTVAAGGSTPLTYYWELSNHVVQAGSSPTYSGTASAALAGPYSVIVSNVTGINATSAPVALVVTPVPTNGYPAAVLASGPIAYYRLDEAPGSTVAYDQIGGNNGTYFDVTLGVPGYASNVDPDTAASFAGENSYVGNISGTAINFAGTGNSFSLEAWANGAAGQPDQSTIIAKGIGNNGTTETEQFAIDTAGGLYRFFTVYKGAIYSAVATEGPNGTWQHVVGTYDATSLTLTIYVDGQAEGSGTFVANGINGTTSPISIGSKRTGNDPNYDGVFTGSIDEVAIYNRALSANEVLNHFQLTYGSNFAPEIVVQPTGGTNYLGLPITLSVGAVGSYPLSYQWYQNGTPIGGATSDSYVINAAASTDAGTYTVNISNTPGSTNSVAVPVVVLSPPTNPPAIPGLVLHLPFNGSLKDTTGRGNNGTGKYIALGVSNSVVLGGFTNTLSPDTNGGSVNPSFYYTAGPFGTNEGLYYSTEATNAATGAIGTNDYFVTLGVLPDLQFGSNISFSVAYWIQLPYNYEAGDLPFFTDTAGSTFGTGYVFAPAYGYGTANPNPTTAPANYGGWADSVFDTGGNGVGYYGDIGTINDGNWHLLVHVIDRKAGTFVTYLDGAVADQTKEGGTSIAAAGNIDDGLPATVGQDPTGKYGEAGSAAIADLGVWRTALTPLNVGALYSAGSASHLSYSYVPFTFTDAVTGPNQLTLTWSFGTLESSSSLSGTFTPVTGATSPYTVNTSGTGLQFYRVAY